MQAVPADWRRMPQVSVVAKGHNSYVLLTHDDSRSEWINCKNAVTAEEAAKAIELGFDDAATITLAQFYDRFMEFHAIPTLSTKTVSRYNSAFVHDVCPILGDTPIARIEPATIESFVDKLRADLGNERGVGSAINVLGTVLGRAVDWRYIQSNPVEKVDLLRIGRAPK